LSAGIDEKNLTRPKPEMLLPSLIYYLKACIHNNFSIFVGNAMIQLDILADRMITLACEFSGKYKVGDFLSCVGEQCVTV
jgi:hypothetical protein